LSRKPFSPACERNREPILQAIAPCLRSLGNPRVLEIGSGTGQHAVCFAAAMPWLTWITSDRPANHAGIRAWLDDASLPNVEGPLTLDVLADFPWQDEQVDAVFSANTAHIMAWEGVQAMVAGVGRCLRPGGVWLLYGPFNRDGRYTSAGNRAFDASLRQEGTGMGIRDLEAVDALARDAGMCLREVRPMPANNFLVDWVRA
jgi:cyclopropane fatty-acyl-phospholipid synthase-like methyltransferase